jgi:hypothetical protein
MAGKLLTPRKKKLTIQPKSAHVSVREGPGGTFDVFGFYLDEYGQHIKPDLDSVAHRVVVLLLRYCNTIGKATKDLAASTDPRDFLSDPEAAKEEPSSIIVPGSGATN